MAAPIDMEAIAGLLVEAAAAAILPRFRRLAPEEVRSKSQPDDLVTAADIECQAFLAERLAGLLPGSNVVGEEGGDQPEQAYRRIAADGWSWIIDPLDGTHNFVHGRGGFTVLLALLGRGLPTAGWIHDPLANATTHAFAGGGAWRQGRRLAVAPARPVPQMTGALYVGARRAPALHARLKRIRDRLGPQSFQRAAGAEYLGLVDGRIDYAIFTRVLPWDHAAGSLIFAEAGGHAALFDGSPYRPTESRDLPLMLAPSRGAWEELRALFDPGAGAGARGAI